MFFLNAVPFLVSLQFYIIGFLMIFYGLMGAIYIQEKSFRIRSVLAVILGILTVILAAFAATQPVIIAIIIGVFAVYSMFKYDSTGSSKSSAEQLFIARLFDMQSGTLWGVNDFAIKNHSEWFGVSAQRNLELQGWIENWSDLDDRIGLGKVMKLVTLNEISSDYLASGLRFSGWFLVVSILNFGYFGSAILCVLLGLIFAIITVAMKKALLKGDILIIAVAVFSYCHFYDYYRIGNFNILFSIPGILCLIILSVYLYGRRKRVRG